jgi:hypothetical protein
MSASVTCARIRSSIRKTKVQNRPKYPRSTWPWNVCTTIDGRARPASKAAARPTAPAFAVCVCRIVGRSARIILARRQVASRSCTGEISRCRWGIVTTWTPRLSAT